MQNTQVFCLFGQGSNGDGAFFQAYPAVIDDIKEKLVQEKTANDSTIIDKTWIKIRESYNLEINDSKIKKEYKNSTK